MAKKSEVNRLLMAKKSEVNHLSFTATIDVKYFNRLCNLENEISYFDLFGDIGGPRLGARLVMNEKWSYFSNVQQYE